MHIIPAGQGCRPEVYHGTNSLPFVKGFFNFRFLQGILRVSFFFFLNFTYSLFATCNKVLL